MTFKRILKKSGMNIEEFSDYFKIPYETVCSWNDGTQPCPDYLMELMNYKIITEERKKIWNSYIIQQYYTSRRLKRIS